MDDRVCKHFGRPLLVAGVALRVDRIRYRRRLRLSDGKNRRDLPHRVSCR